MKESLKWRLSVMMFLEFAIWGAWQPVLGAYMSSDLKLNAVEMGVIFSLLPLATIISPMLFGQIADRYVPTQVLLGALHLAGAVILWMMPGFNHYLSLGVGMMLLALLYAPTLVLVNSISFHHLRDSEREFGGIRVGGTAGWMVAGFVLSNVMHSTGAVGHSAAWRVAAAFAVILGVFCFTLPNTPPQREGADPWAFLRAVGLMRDRNFLVFTIVSFFVATELAFYYNLTSQFLEQRMGVDPRDTSAVMTTAQFAELFVMALLLPYLLPRWGVRKTMVVGILAWPIRYGIFALGAMQGPSLRPLVEASLTLHGLCYVFFFVVGVIYVDTVAPTDIRASAQSLIGLITLGAGMYFGSIFTGWIQQRFTIAPASASSPAAINWTGVFLVPCVLTILCGFIFPVLFRADPAPAAGELEREPVPLI